MSGKRGVTTPGELYRGARLTGALDWAAQHDDQLSALEREFIQSSRIAAERHNRRLRTLLLGVGALLIFAVAAGVIALIKQQSASQTQPASRSRDSSARRRLTSRGSIGDVAGS